MRLEIMTKPGMEAQEKELSRTGYAHIAFGVGERSRRYSDKATQNRKDVPKKT